ncbi:hypothetical protein [Myroides guanonis]|uniref:hypothetical protein n=1 Tax=Myroides guanonis TaxID=1150112 RepID=UPI0015A5E717|nr:hypothetical protein [Myroides guanonis]
MSQMVFETGTCKAWCIVELRGLEGDYVTFQLETETWGLETGIRGQKLGDSDLETGDWN